MTEMRSALLLCGLFLTLPLAAQSPAEPPDSSEITVLLDGRQRAQLRLALPEPAGMEAMDAPTREAARTLDATLRADLERSGVFLLQGPQQLGVLRLTGERERDFDLYRSLGNEILLENEVRQEGDRIVLEGRLFELDSRSNILAKRYRGQLEIARRIAHTLSDDLMEFFTGRKGIALTTIAFHSDRQAGDQREIYLMDYDGENQRPVTAHKTLSMSPDWSPDGRHLAYTTWVRWSPGIFLAELRTGRKTPLVTDGELNISPSFSPDGRRLAFAHKIDGANIEIFVANRDGSGMRRLTSARGIDTNPAWSPSGRDLAFTSSRAGSPQIYVVSAEGTDLRRVTFEGAYNDGAAWHPDGTRIAHASRRGNDFVIALTDLVTLESRTVPSGDGSHEAPSFSPDGREIAYASRRGSGSGRSVQIYVTRVDGSGVRQLTNQGNNWAPAWSPLPQ